MYPNFGTHQECHACGNQVLKRRFVERENISICMSVFEVFPDHIGVCCHECGWTAKEKLKIQSHLGNEAEIG